MAADYISSHLSAPKRLQTLVEWDRVLFIFASLALSSVGPIEGTQ